MEIDGLISACMCVCGGGGEWLIRKGQEGEREGGNLFVEVGGPKGDCRVIGRGRGGKKIFLKLHLFLVLTLWVS